jgi:hypothetical protein
VLYVFGRGSIDEQDLLSKLPKEKLLIFYDTMYDHEVHIKLEPLIKNEDVIFTQLLHNFQKPKGTALPATKSCCGTNGEGCSTGLELFGASN